MKGFEAAAGRGAKGLNGFATETGVAVDDARGNRLNSRSNKQTDDGRTKDQATESSDCAFGGLLLFGGDLAWPEAACPEGAHAAGDALAAA